MGESRVGTEGPVPPENHKNIGFPSNIDPNPPKNHKATKPSFKGGPLSTRKRNAISMAFRLWADDGPLLLAFRSSLHPIKKQKQKKPHKTPQKTKQRQKTNKNVVVSVGLTLTKFS